MGGTILANSDQTHRPGSETLCGSIPGCATKIVR